MSTYNKFNVFVEDLVNKVHDLFGSGAAADVARIYLSNTAPVATNSLKSQVAEISGGNGYTVNGESTQNSGTRSGGTVTLTGTRVVWTAAGGPIGPFRYVVLFNDTPSAPLDPLISWWDYGSALTLLAGETFTVRFNNGDPTGTIFTLA